MSFNPDPSDSDDAQSFQSENTQISTNEKEFQESLLKIKKSN